MRKESILSKVKPEVRAISAYTLREYDYEIKINQNENPYDVPEQLKRRILDFAFERSWSRYPPFEPDELHMLLAEYTGWDVDGVLVGNGSNELIIKINNTANSRDRRFSVQVLDDNNGGLVDQHATGTNHTQTVSGNITTITLPGMNGFGATGYRIILR